MVPVSTFAKAFRWCHYQLSMKLSWNLLKFCSKKRGSGWAKIPVEEKIRNINKSPANDEILDLDSIMFVIGLVQMLHFFMKSWFSGSECQFFSGDSVRHGPLCYFTNPALNFGWKRMASISTFARNFAKGKNSSLPQITEGPPCEVFCRFV